MIAWMVSAALVGALIAAGASAVERLVASAGRPRRFVWLAALFPWSPAIWWMCRRLRAAVELDCDERVPASGIGVAAYGGVLLEAGDRSRSRWGFAPAMGQPESLLERRLKTMSEKPGKLSAGRAVVLAGVAAGALAAACDVPAPTELREAIGEVRVVEARDSRDGSPPDATGGSYLAGWFASEPAPLVFVDGVRVARYEDLPEPVRRWSESGLREAGLVDRVQVLKGVAAREVWGEEGANGAIRILTGDGPLDESIVEPPGFGPGEPNDGLWGEKFPGVSKAFVIVIDGVVGRDDDPEHARRLTELAPGDIDTIEVIKGPRAALRLYGHDARGVLRIHTRKGSRQRTGDRAWEVVSE